MTRSELRAMFKGATYGGEFYASMEKASRLYEDAIRSWTNDKIADPAMTTIIHLGYVRRELNKAKKAIEMLEHVVGNPE